MATGDRSARAVDDHVAAAHAAARETRKHGEYAVAAFYEPRERRIRVELASGAALLVPVAGVPGLADARNADLRIIEVQGAGMLLHWPRLDADLGVAELAAAVLGNRAWMAAFARLAGSRTSWAKAEAARRNGRKGGRPRKAAKAAQVAPRARS